MMTVEERVQRREERETQRLKESWEALKQEVIKKVKEKKMTLTENAKKYWEISDSDLLQKDL